MKAEPIRPTREDADFYLEERAASVWLRENDIAVTTPLIDLDSVSASNLIALEA